VVGYSPLKVVGITSRLQQNKQVLSLWPSHGLGLIFYGLQLLAFSQFKIANYKFNNY
jgi:hypothetical protein